MNGNLILTKDSVPADIERYFRGVLALDQQDKVFSVNLDDVWQLAYSRKDNAVRALKANFMENVDYIAIQKSENSSLPQNADQDWGGNNKVDYYITSACLEYFVARKVRPVFEVYRRVFHHAVAQVQQQSSLQEQIQAKLAFADWSAKFLNLNDASKLGIAQKIGKMVGLDDALPQSVNAGTEKPITHAATDLLKQHNVGISAQAFNRMLELKGVVKHATRPGKRGKVHSWYVITPAFDKYGQNINATLLQNVEQPKLAKTLIKLREVYVDFMSEVDRAKEEYGVLVNDRIDDKFASQYNVMSTLISNTLAKIMDYEVNEAIKD